MGALDRQISGVGWEQRQLALVCLQGSVDIRGCTCSVKQGDLLMASWLRAYVAEAM